MLWLLSVKFSSFILAILDFGNDRIGLRSMEFKKRVASCGDLQYARVFQFFHFVHSFVFASFQCVHDVRECPMDHNRIILLCIGCSAFTDHINIGYSPTRWITYNSFGTWRHEDGKSCNQFVEKYELNMIISDFRIHRDVWAWLECVVDL